MTGQEFDGHKILKGGYFYEYAREIADAVSVPVYVTGGFLILDLWESTWMNLLLQVLACQERFCVNQIW